MRAATMVVVFAAGVAAVLSAPSHAQVRVAQWNITNWIAGDVGSRGAAFKTAFYGTSPGGLQFVPDVIIVEEMTQGGYASQGGTQAIGQANVDAFRGVLNDMGAGSPGDWASADYMFNTGDTGNALFYRTSKFVCFNGDTIKLDFNTGTQAGQPPRDDQRWHIRLVGYSGPGADLYLYGAHFKSGSASTDQARRTPDANRIRGDSGTLANATPGLGGYIFGADFNIQTSSQAAYQVLVGSPGSAGQFIDPINTPGSWNNNSSFAIVHTQEPSGNVNGGGMDDRHDQLLVSPSLLDHQGLSYIFAPSAMGGGNPYGIFPYSTITWNDPNHTYRCWGNDGSHYNLGIVDGGFNNQVGTTIGSALVTTVEGNGHLPVYFEMQVPAKLGGPSGTIDFGTVALNAAAQVQVQITNAADVPRFSKSGTGFGIDALTYTFAASAGFTAPGGPFERTATGAPAQANLHTISMDTSTPGPKSGTLTITTDDPGNPTRVIQLTGLVPQPADYDVDNDGLANAEDIYRWFDLQTDVDGSGAVNSADLVAVFAHDRTAQTADMTQGRR